MGIKNLNEIKLGVIGLGYVGLPLAIEFGKKVDVLGFDINVNRVRELIARVDRTLEVAKDEFKDSKGLRFSSEASDLASCNIYIITVPTPVDSANQPDLTPIIEATKLVGKYIKKGDYVIYESTVYPGCTEEVCKPILEEISLLKFNEDFFIGYSPERINPGDKQHRIQNIRKVVSGSNADALELIDFLYSQIIIAGTYKAQSIRVAEAAKVIENTQRDVNIALINELSIIFNKMNIDTGEVLDAAGSKWNFLPFRPGLVGGHCIGVDPYYLTHKAQSLGYHPEIILAGRRINDGMGQYIASQFIKGLVKKKIHIEDSNILVMGLTFKENCPDIRNTKVMDIVQELKEYNCTIDIYDPWVDLNDDLMKEEGVSLISNVESGNYDGVIIAVAHDEFKSMGIAKIKSWLKNPHVIYDLKHLFDKSDTDFRL